jgi:hypothetical protein
MNGINDCLALLQDAPLITWANVYLNKTYIFITLFRITVQSGTVVTSHLAS